jgi:hypothetical protein
MDDIVYTTPEQQIEKLKSHHLAFFIPFYPAAICHP